tara:strand:+ start:100 stop:573 length:474 start_codon:yes stop_codon:yes gene_type:complete
MINNVKKCLLPLIVFFLGCSSEIEYSGHIEIPIYKDCEIPLSKFIDELEDNYKGTNVDFQAEIRHFDHVSEAHKDISGYVVLSANNLPGNIDLYANSITGICHPRAFFKVDNSLDGFSIIITHYVELMGGAHKKGYFVLEKDSIKVFYNQKYSEYWD